MGTDLRDTATVEGGIMTRRVIAAVDDMFFASKIRATAEHLNVDVRFVRSVDSLMNAVREGESFTNRL